MWHNAAKTKNRYHILYIHTHLFLGNMAGPLSVKEIVTAVAIVKRDRIPTPVIAVANEMAMNAAVTRGIALDVMGDGHLHMSVLLY